MLRRPERLFGLSSTRTGIWCMGSPVSLDIWWSHQRSTFCVSKRRRGVICFCDQHWLLQHWGHAHLRCFFFMWAYISCMSRLTTPDLIQTRVYVCVHYTGASSAQHSCAESLSKTFGWWHVWVLYAGVQYSKTALKPQGRVTGSTIVVGAMDLLAACHLSQLALPCTALIYIAQFVDVSIEQCLGGLTLRTGSSMTTL